MVRFAHHCPSLPPHNTWRVAEPPASLAREAIVKGVRHVLKGKSLLPSTNPQRGHGAPVGVPRELACGSGARRGIRASKQESKENGSEPEPGRHTYSPCHDG